MNEHRHPEYVPGCFRCDLSREENDLTSHIALSDEDVERIARQVAEVLRRQAIKTARARAVI